MARIKNVELPREKRVVIGITSIHGIGASRAKDICDAAKVNEDKRVKDLTEEEINSLRKEVEKYVVEGDLRRETQMSVKNLMEIKCYRGVRHIKGLPVRGQRTITNARTRKGHNKTVANKKKVGK